MTNSRQRRKLRSKFAMQAIRSKIALVHLSPVFLFYRKEFENNQLLSKIADEQAINNQLQKKMKELHVMKIKVRTYQTDNLF